MKIMRLRHRRQAAEAAEGGCPSAEAEAFPLVEAEEEADSSFRSLC